MKPDAFLVFNLLALAGLTILTIYCIVVSHTQPSYHAKRLIESLNDLHQWNVINGYLQHVTNKMIIRSGKDTAQCEGLYGSDLTFINEPAKRAIHLITQNALYKHSIDC